MNPIRYQMMRLWLRCYRFQMLPIANRFFKNASSGTIVETPFFGFTLPLEVARTTTHRMLSLLSERHVVERSLLARLVRRDDCVCDVGANIGYYLLMFERFAGPGGRVVCIEPEPANLVQLRRVVRENAFSNVEVLPVAAGDRAGRVQLQEGINGRVRLDDDDGCSVAMIKLDSLADRNFTFIKIDIEGFEGQALAGMQNLMRTQAPRLFVEVHPLLLEYGFSVRDVIGLVRAHYQQIRFWAPARSSSAWSKALIRYLPGKGIRELGDANVLLEKCASGEQTEPFWMVCS